MVWKVGADNIAHRYAIFLCSWDVDDMIWDDCLVGQLTTDNASPTQDQDVGFSAKLFFSSTITLIMVGTSVGLSSTTTIQRRTRTRTMMTAPTAPTTNRTPSVCSEATWPTVSCSTTTRSSASSSLASRLRLRRAGSIEFCCFCHQFCRSVQILNCNGSDPRWVDPEHNGESVWRKKEKIFLIRFLSCVGNKIDQARIWNMMIIVSTT